MTNVKSPDCRTCNFLSRSDYCICPKYCINGDEYIETKPLVLWATKNTGTVEIDPCPGCRKGGVCRTMACGRLKLREDHPFRTVSYATLDVREQARKGCGDCFAQDCNYPNCIK